MGACDEMASSPDNCSDEFRRSLRSHRLADNCDSGGILGLLSETKVTPDIKFKFISEPDDPPEEEDPFDSSSRRGHFGWETLGSIHIPYLFRYGEPYCAARTLGGAVKFRVRPEIFACASVKGTKSTLAEAQLLETINIQHCGRSLGARTFSLGEPLIKLQDARDLLTYLQKCHSKLSNRSGPCGLLRLSSKETLIPYVIINNFKYVPMSCFENENRIIDIPRMEVSGWDLSYLKFCYTVFDDKNEFLNVNKCMVLCLNDIEKAYKYQFEEYWPKNTSKPITKGKKKVKILAEPEFIEVENSPANESSPDKITITPDLAWTDSDSPDQENIGNRGEKSEFFMNKPQNEIKSEKTKERKRKKDTTEQLPDKPRIRRTRFASESEEQRQRRLLNMRVKQAQRIANETKEQRETRLLKLRQYQSRRLANETKEQRKRRLLQLRVNQARRLAKLKGTPNES